MTEHRRNAKEGRISKLYQHMRAGCNISRSFVLENTQIYQRKDYIIEKKNISSVMTVSRMV